MGEYWDFLQSRRLRRRSFLGRTAAASAGVAGLALVGCGDDDDDDDDDATSDATEAEGTSAATSTATAAATGEATSDADEGGDEETASATAQAGDVKTGGELKMMDLIASDVFDPAITIHAGSLYQGVIQVYDLINRSTVDFQLEGQMADLPEQPDETTTVYTFKQGITWQDRPPLNGRPFTAEDAVFGLERFREPNPEFTFGGRFTAVDRFEAVDERTLQVITNGPFAPLLANIAEDNMLMVAPEAVDEFGNDGLKLFENMIGTGAFMPDSFEQGVKSRIVRNPNYWQQGKPYLDAVSVTQITDAAQQEAAFVSGQVDMNAGWGMGTGAAVADTLQSQLGDDMIVELKQLVGRYSIHFNTTREPYGDERVRRALHLAVDRLAINAALGNSHQYMGPVPQHVRPYGFSEDELAALPGYREEKDEDLEEATALLAAAGFGDGLTVNVLGPSPVGPANEVIQQNWAAIGVEMNITPVTIPEWITARVNGDFDIVSVSITEAADPDQALYGANHTDGSVNFGKFSDPEVDRLAEQQRILLDVDERKAVTDELQNKLLELSPQIWTMSYVFRNTLRSYVKDFTVVPGYQGWPFADTWLDKES